jgi:hypothetical protein
MIARYLRLVVLAPKRNGTAKSTVDTTHGI